MRNSNTAKAGRIAAGILAWMMLVIVLFSVFCIGIEADHDCTGEDCLICASIRQCESILRGFGDGITVPLSGLIPVLFILLIAGLSPAAFPLNTLVSGKVRLNN